MLAANMSMQNFNAVFNAVLPHEPELQVYRAEGGSILAARLLAMLMGSAPQTIAKDFLLLQYNNFVTPNTPQVRPRHGKRVMARWHFGVAFYPSPTRGGYRRTSTKWPASQQVPSEPRQRQGRGWGVSGRW
jgi:hypothetical protein